MISLALLTAAQVAAQPVFTNNRVPNAEIIRKLENAIVMPKGARPLTAYDRTSQAPLRRVSMKEWTPAFDGGCAILAVVYEVAAISSPKVACNPGGPH